MTDSDIKNARALCEAADSVSEREWQYIDGPLMCDVCVETRPTSPGRSRIRLDPGPLGPFIAASRTLVSALLDEVERRQGIYDDLLEAHVALINEANAERDRLRALLGEALKIWRARRSAPPAMSDFAACERFDAIAKESGL